MGNVGKCLLVLSYDVLVKFLVVSGLSFSIGTRREVLFFPVLPFIDTYRLLFKISSYESLLCLLLSFVLTQKKVTKEKVKAPGKKAKNARYGLKRAISSSGKQIRMGGGLLCFNYPSSSVDGALF